MPYFIIYTCTVESITGISPLAGTRVTSVSVYTGGSRETTSVIQRTLVDICVDSNNITT